MNYSSTSHRAYFLAGFLISAGILGISIYLQLVLKLDPCPLCIMQRLVFACLALVFLIAGLHNPGVTGIRIYGSCAQLLTLAGIYFSGRHVWLEYHPNAIAGSCGPNLAYMLQNYPWADSLKVLLNGSAECAKVSWTFLNLSLPTWALIGFLSFWLSTLGLLFVKRAPYELN